MMISEEQMITEELFKTWCKAMEAYQDRVEFYYATHPIPILPIASGEHLDALGALFCLKRKEDENDDEFRKRIHSSVVVTT